MQKSVKGFSKLSKTQKIDWITNTYFSDDESAKKILIQYWNTDQQLQNLHDEFIENTLSNYYLPFAVAPNFMINGSIHTIPMVIEESSVVAAASKAAKFWLDRGGFKAVVLGTQKTGQVHFNFSGEFNALDQFFQVIKPRLLESVKPLTLNMERRGGGLKALRIIDKSQDLDNYYQLHAEFETKDAMGANFINSCLEQLAKTLKEEAENFYEFQANNQQLEIIMSILSNYVPDCLVRAEVSCPVLELQGSHGITSEQFAKKFVQAVQIAEVEPYRAVTHNKGIMNGIDAVVLATGNDFRAIEAGVHAYACKDGVYGSLSHAVIEDGIFKFWLEIPLALGTVGGLTKLHPLVKFALQLLGQPTAEDLMKIVAVAGLAQNFSALRSLITTGIQEGHMKMHLMNILNQYQANDKEKAQLLDHFKNHSISFNAVGEALNEIRVKDADVL